MDKQYVYIIVRTDLSPEQVAVQAAHAGMLCAFQYSLSGTQHIVLLGVNDETQLQASRKYLSDHKIQGVIVNEPDLNNSLTAIATCAISDQKQRNLFRRFRLYKGNVYETADNTSTN